MARETITVKLKDGKELAFCVPDTVAESVFEQLFESKGSVDPMQAKNIALTSSDVEAVINVLTFCSNYLDSMDLLNIYTKYKEEVRIVGEIAANIQTPDWVLEEIIKHPEETVAAMAEETLAEKKK